MNQKKKCESALKDQIIKLIHFRAMKRLAQHSKALITAEPGEKEAILADITIERELADCCRLCLDGKAITG